ncbi:MAG: hypothetical protein GX484_11830 [Chloroflexi bacterium]|nr:hypothetical protein [Chloroflexota bacterium]
MSRTTLRLVIAVLTIATASIHLFLGLTGLGDGVDTTFDILFILNGLGYLALLAALLGWLPVLNTRPGLTHTLFIAYTALTFVLYFVMNGFSEFGSAAIVAKVAEALLIVALVVHMNAARAVEPGMSSY